MKPYRLAATTNTAKAVATGLLLAAVTSTLAADGPSALRPGLVNRDVQQDLGYQSSAEHLARMAQLLERALQEAKAAEAAYALPGFSYAALRGDIQQIIEGVEPLLAPEKRRLRYQTLTPDGMYFQLPAGPTDSTTPDRKDE